MASYLFALKLAYLLDSALTQSRYEIKTFNVAWSSARLIWLASFAGESQHVYSRIASCLSNTRYIARQLASTHVLTSPVTHQSPWVGSSWCTVEITSVIIYFEAFTVSFYPFVSLASLIYIFYLAKQAKRCSPLFMKILAGCNIRANKGTKGGISWIIIR